MYTFIPTLERPIYISIETYLGTIRSERLSCHEANTGSSSCYDADIVLDGEKLLYMEITSVGFGRHNGQSSIELSLVGIIDRWWAINQV